MVVRKTSEFLLGEALSALLITAAIRTATGRRGDAQMLLYVVDSEVCLCS